MSSCPRTHAPRALSGNSLLTALTQGKCGVTQTTFDGHTRHRHPESRRAVSDSHGLVSAALWSKADRPSLLRGTIYQSPGRAPQLCSRKPKSPVCRPARGLWRGARPVCRAVSPRTPWGGRDTAQRRRLPRHPGGDAGVESAVRSPGPAAFSASAHAAGRPAPRSAEHLFRGLDPVGPGPRDREEASPLNCVPLLYAEVSGAVTGQARARAVVGKAAHGGERAEGGGRDAETLPRVAPVCFNHTVPL